MTIILPRGPLVRTGRCGQPDRQRRNTGRRLFLLSLAGLTLLGASLFAPACGGNGEEKASPTPSGTQVTPETQATVPAGSRETIFTLELSGIHAKVELLTPGAQYVATVSAPTLERYREGKAELEKRLPSLVPDPCRVVWTSPILLADEIEPDDLRTSGCPGEPQSRDFHSGSKASLPGEAVRAGELGPGLSSEVKWA